MMCSHSNFSFQTRLFVVQASCQCCTGLLEGLLYKKSN